MQTSDLLHHKWVNSKPIWVNVGEDGGLASGLLLPGEALLPHPFPKHLRVCISPGCFRMASTGAGRGTQAAAAAAGGGDQRWLTCGCVLPPSLPPKYCAFLSPGCLPPRVAGDLLMVAYFSLKAFRS